MSGTKKVLLQPHVLSNCSLERLAKQLRTGKSGEVVTLDILVTRQHYGELYIRPVNVSVRLD